MQVRHGCDTPWGEADEVIKIGDIPAWIVGTPGHGGHAVSERWAEANLSPAALSLGIHEYGHYWYEEDCDWCVPALDSVAYYAALGPVWVATRARDVDLARFDEIMADCRRNHEGYASAGGEA